MKTHNFIYKKSNFLSLKLCEKETGEQLDGSRDVQAITVAMATAFLAAYSWRIVMNFKIKYISPEARNKYLTSKEPMTKCNCHLSQL